MSKLRSSCFFSPLVIPTLLDFQTNTVLAKRGLARAG